MTPSANTRRYELLCNALEELISDPRTSKRVRLSSIQRLDDLLHRAERREASEGRRIEREALRAAKVQGETETPTPVLAIDNQMERAQVLIAGIIQKGNELRKS